MFQMLPQSAMPISASALNFQPQQALSFSQGPLSMPGVDTSQVLSRANPGFSAVSGADGLDIWGKADIALGGLATLGNLWNAFKANKLAKQQFKWTKGITEANLRNSTQAYNTAISDRARSRGHTEGQSQQQIDNYVSANSLKQFKG